MKRPIAKLWVGLLSFIIVAAAWDSGIYAQTVAPNDLTIIQLKMTGSETLVLMNTSKADINLLNYTVQYFNKNNPASLIAPTNSQALPDITIGPNQAILLNSDGAQTCGAAAVAEMEFTLADSSGLLAISKVESLSDGSVLFKQQDRVSWTTAASGADLVKVPSATADPKALWYRKIPEGTWQQAQLGTDCAVIKSMIAVAESPTYVQWATGEEPPATIFSAPQVDKTPANNANTGLSLPLITEMLPNTASPQTDSEDEFIELYNSNTKEFDLSGFSFEIGLTAKRIYKFPDKTKIAARSFKIFYSGETGLALTNTGSQVRLLDPAGSQVGQSQPYGSAKDGQSWALANGKWYWTSSPTPGAANVIRLPAASSAAKKSSSRSKTTAGLVKGASTSSQPSAASTLSTTADSPSRVHPAVLAGVGSVALLYGLYEYRQDLSNRLFQLRRYIRNRRS